MLTTLDLLLIHVKRCLQSEVFHYLARHRGTSQLFPGFTYFSTRILFANCFYYFRNISYCRLLFFPNRIPSSSAGLSDRSSLILGVTYPEEFICFQNIKLFCSFAREKPKSHSWSSTSNCFVCRSTEGITCHLFSKFNYKYIHPSIKTYFSIITIFPDILTFIFSLALQFGFPWQTDS